MGKVERWRGVSAEANSRFGHRARGRVSTLCLAVGAIFALYWNGLQ